MFFEFRFWKYLFHQQELAMSLKDSTMRDFKGRVWFVVLCGVLLFALRDVWGMHTEGLTSLFAKGFGETYVIARIVSLIGAILWSLIYIAFYFFGISYILHKLTNVDLAKIAVLQLFVVSLLLMEKAFVFILYSLVGYTTDFSVLSFGPMAALFLSNKFFIYFFNELSLVTGLIVALQYQFLRIYTDLSGRNLIIILIAIPVVLALLVAGFEILPIEKWIEGGQAA
ncbi:MULTISPECIES: hypothetical protein [Psychrobacillus]|uniref:Yip1 domain-containing protein n=1 Tax=Psychrobacillus faecigallinarum TaxID=2762235 RepID=A0ABR8R6C1_9BACI|nr:MULTISPECIES: hypothetical protein [Psychrobacillus]MBD7943311.1 hypothetical protein [Psychrobacillus faecigallinarum]QEY20739.1 hypothetical protein D0S48_08525 [Psychrobacillus sp. AK 1817]